MTRTGSWPFLALAYVALAVLGATLTWTFNVRSFAAGDNYFGDWFGSGPAVLSLTVDVLWVAVVVIIAMSVEARRLGMRHVWVYAVAIFVIALAFALPLFLCMRERQLHQRGQEAAGAAAA